MFVFCTCDGTSIICSVNSTNLPKELGLDDRESPFPLLLAHHSMELENTKAMQMKCERGNTKRLITTIELVFVSPANIRFANIAPSRGDTYSRMISLVESILTIQRCANQGNLDSSRRACIVF